MSDRHRVKEPPRFLAATVTAFMAVGLTGCSSDSDEYVHCIDENGYVVDPDLCEDEEDEYNGYYSGGGSYWYYVSRTRYSVGSSVPSDYTSSRIHPSDSSARTRAGLSSSGGIGGTTVRGGGFGSGGGYDGGGGYRSGGG